jgi:peptide-methionine (R)-S-oxide reductase
MSAAFAEWRVRREQVRAEQHAKRRRAAKARRKNNRPAPPPEPEAFPRVARVPLTARAACAIESESTCVLTVGCRVRVLDRRTLANGTSRAKIANECASQQPVGWVTCTDEDGCSTLLEVFAPEARPSPLGRVVFDRVTTKVSRSHQISPDVLGWLESLSDERRAVEEAWASHLAAEAFRVLRMRHTEDANKGVYTDHFAPGAYECAGCGRRLYSASHKFASECGWASFADCVPTALERVPHKPKVDEIRCATCGGHGAYHRAQSALRCPAACVHLTDAACPFCAVGHVFSSPFHPPPKRERHCANSLALRFVPEVAGEEDLLCA